MMGIEVEKKSKAVFGTTLDREIFPSKVPPTRFGNDLTPIRGAANRGPGCYNNEEVSNLMYGVKTKIVSDKGYTLGARTAARFPKDSGERTRFVYDLTNFKTPAPPTYQTKCTDPIEFDPAYKSFNAAAARFPVYRRDVEEVSPGPGTYEHSIEGDRKVTWHQSFGGTPINLPSVSQHSTISKNTEKSLSALAGRNPGEMLISTKDEKKYHRRLAYLKLYYQ